MASAPVPRDRNDFNVAILCALPLEAECVIHTLDQVWEDKRHDPLSNDDSAYTIGRIGEHNVVIVHMPGMGTIRAASAASNLKFSYPSVKLALVVGVCGAMPIGNEDEEILLGDVIISKALIQYDFGKQYHEGFKRSLQVVDNLGAPNEKVLGLLSKLEAGQYREDLQAKTVTILQTIQQKTSKANHPGSKHDILYNSSYAHRHHKPTQCHTCATTDDICEAAIGMKCEDLKCEDFMHVPRRRLLDPTNTQPVIHVGEMGCANTVMKSGQHRDNLARIEKVIAVEMEGAGVWRHGPCIVIKGVCDYADSHKRKKWQRYATATAAACTKAFLLDWWAPDKQKNNSVITTPIDQLLLESYNNGRLHVERLSGYPLPLESCFINLSIIHHSRDIDARFASDKPNRDSITQGPSQFSLAARLRTETPRESDQVTLDTLFEPRQQSVGTQPRPNRILIWGRAGMGKTTLCKKIVHSICNSKLWKDFYDRVIWLPLRNLRRKESRDVVELLMHEFPCTKLGERISEDFDKLVQDERTLFLLDGLDEVSLFLEPDSSQERVIRALLSRSHVIITSRPHSTYQLHYRKLDLELEVVGFSQSQIDEYLQHIERETQVKGTATEIQSFIEQRPLLRSIAAIPIQLDAICYSWNADTFPRDHVTMTSLYLAISTSLWKNSALRLGKQRNDIPNTREWLDHQTWRQVEILVKEEIIFLQELAFRGLCEEMVEFSPEYIESLQLTQQVPSEDMVHLAFLRTSDSSVEIQNRTFHFIHLTFQEFFAAQHFVGYWMSNKAFLLRQATVDSGESTTSTELIMPEDFVHSRKYSDRYDIFWRFVVGLLQEPDKRHLYRFLTTLESSPIDFIGLAHQRLIVHCLSELRQGDSKLQTHIRNLEDRYVHWALSQSRLKPSWKGSRTVDRMRSLLSEVECSVYILETLLRNGQTAVEVLNVLCYRTNITQRMLDVVVQLLHGNPKGTIRDAAVKLIGRHCSHDQVKVLALFTPLQIAEAWRYVSGLLEPGIMKLTQLLRDQDDDVRLSAAQALSFQVTLPNAAVEALMQLLRDPDDEVRRGAVIALRKQATLPDVVIERLLQLLRDPDDDVRRGAVIALRKQAILPDVVVERLSQLLRDPDDDVRRGAVIALSEQATLPDVVVERLSQLLRDLDSGVRWGAVITLRKQATLPDVVVERLLQLLRDLDSGVRWGAVITLRKQATLPDIVVERLLQLLQTSDYFNARPIVELIIFRPELRSRIADLNSLALKHFVKYCFATGSWACFIWKGNFCMASSGRVQMIRLQQHQLKQIEERWQIARNSVGLPDFVPIIDPSCVV